MEDFEDSCLFCSTSAGKLTRNGGNIKCSVKCELLGRRCLVAFNNRIMNDFNEILLYVG